ncbi:MAG: pyridoxamine 5'-phosphate oxidase family protein [Actinomycetota bacterium]
MDWEAFLNDRPLAVIATVGADGFAHAVPVEVVTYNGSVFVWCNASSVKCRNAEREGRASIVAYKGNDGVLVRGAARVLTSNDPNYETITRRFLEKYKRTESYGNDALIQISADRLSVFS